MTCDAVYAADYPTLQAAVDVAVVELRPVYAPGVYEIDANNGNQTGLHINAPEGFGFVMFGGGTVRRQGTGTLAPTSPLVWLKANEGARYRFPGMVIDGNEANCPFDPDDLYVHEQSANVKWKSGSGVPDGVDLTDTTMTGCVGDGYHANVSTRYCEARRFTAHGRGRRVRADFQLSRVPLKTTHVVDSEMDAFEMEPSGVSYEHVIALADVLVRGAFDLSGDGSNRANVYATNVTALATEGIGNPFVNFNRVSGHFKSCTFRGIRRIQRSRVLFEGCTITIPDDGTGKGAPIQCWHDQAGCVEEFVDCSFGVDASVTALDLYIHPVSANADVGRKLIVRDSTSSFAGKYFALSNRAGTVVLDGGTLSATDAVLRLTHGSGPYISAGEVYNPGLWAGAPFSIGLANGEMRLRAEWPA